jgi:uncharacterized membrane protein
MRGPIDFIVIGFAEPEFKGEILDELAKASQNNTIAVLAAVVVAKDKDGAVTIAEVTDDDVAAAMDKMGADPDIIDLADIAEVGEMLENNTAAGLLIIEHVWARGLKQAIANANGVLLSEGRIHPEASKELETVKR